MCEKHSAHQHSIPIRIALYWTGLALRHGENGAFFFVLRRNYTTLFHACQYPIFIFPRFFPKSLYSTKILIFFRFFCGFTFLCALAIMNSQIAARHTVRNLSASAISTIKLMIGPERCLCFFVFLEFFSFFHRCQPSVLKKILIYFK